jgi:hypothetical protein
MTNSVAQWFNLNRSNFIIDPRTDSGIFAPREEINTTELLQGLEVTLITDRAPKRLIWGVYGGGKTHTLFFIGTKLAEMQSVEPIYVECPSVPKNSTFIDLYKDGIMASIGQERTISLFKNLIQKIGLIDRDDLLSKLQKDYGDEELSRAIINLYLSDTDKELTFWRYISGNSLSPSQLKELQITQSISEANATRLANIIITIGKISKSIENKTMVLIIDELDRLTSIGNEYGINTYQEGLRRLVDENQTSVALLLGCSAANIKDIPEIFGGEAGPVLGRIGKTNIIEIRDIPASEVDRFIKYILQKIVDQNVAKQKIESLKNSTKETIELDLYPFTVEAIDTLKGKLSGVMTPREITMRMSDAAGKAFLLKKEIITSDIFGGR